MKKLKGEDHTVVIKDPSGGSFEFKYVPYHCDNPDCPEYLLEKSHDMKTGKPRAPDTINAYNREDIEEYIEQE